MQDAPGPLGVPSMWWLVMLVPVLGVPALAVAVVRRRQLLTLPVLAVIVGCLAAAVWAFVTAGADVRIPIPEDPEGSDCLFASNTPVVWGDPCGAALARQLAIGAGPGLIMVALAVGSLALRRRAPASSRAIER